jgi:hypothetical protein
VARLGLKRQRGEAPGQYAQRAVVAIPELSDQLWLITNLYNELAYENPNPPGVSSAETLRKFCRAVAGFKPDRRRRVEDDGVIL